MPETPRRRTPAAAHDRTATAVVVARSPSSGTGPVGRGE